MSADLIHISMLIVLATKSVSIARVDQGEAVLSISNPSGHITSGQEGIVESWPIQKKSISEILNKSSIFFLVKIVNQINQTQTKFQTHP